MCVTLIRSGASSWRHAVISVALVGGYLVQIAPALDRLRLRAGGPAPGVGVLSTVPFVSDSWLQTASDTFNGQPLEFADGESTANGELSDGGMCLPDDPAGEWSGKIVLCERGDWIAVPAGTRHWSASSISADPQLRSSCLSKPAALAS